MNIQDLYTLCKQSDTSLTSMLLRFVYYKMKGRQILAHQNTILKGVRNIETKGVLQVGIDYIGFVHKRDTTLLNIQGKCIIQGNVAIGKGCRFDIGKNATVEIGKNTRIRPLSKFIILQGLTIGEDCSISWDCQFMDADFHTLEYPDKKEIADNRIIIGDHVWIGSGVSVYKGAVIGKNSVIASNSVVKSKFEEENVLIAGNPARIIKRDVVWK